jgi:hypothetical protein
MKQRMGKPQKSAMDAMPKIRTIAPRPLFYDVGRKKDIQFSQGVPHGRQNHLLDLA